MQTQYRLLYRYVNPTTNTAITNEAEYVPTEEFFHPKHKANVDASYLNTLQNDGYNLLYKAEGTDQDEYVAMLRNEGDKEREAIITENMANENKSNNLYVYNGTKKYFHKNFIPDQLGYVVRDWTKVPSSQIPKGPDDYSKHFVMLGGNQLGVDNAYLVCKPEYIDTYMKAKDNSNAKCFINFSTNDNTNKGYAKNAAFYKTSGYIKDVASIIDDATFFKWYNDKIITDVPTYGEIPPSGVLATDQTRVNPTTGETWLITKWTTVTRSSSTSTTTGGQFHYLFWDNTKGNYVYPTIATATFTITTGTSSSGTTSTYTGWKLDSLTSAGYLVGTYASNLCVNQKNIIQTVIPAHYEESGDNPYIIKDTYKKVALSPWILHSVHKSLESGLDSAKKLVSMLGISNVKLIKYVPVDQFIKIK